MIGKGYVLRGVFVTNAELDGEGRSLSEAAGIRVYDRTRICDEFIETDAEAGIDGWAELDVSDSDPLTFSAGTKANVFVISATAQDLLSLKGLADGRLFSQNVRLSLGNTKVNKDIADTLSKKEEHIFFPLYHNGITILCDEAELTNGKLKIKGYMVVNGAQSLSVVYHNRDKLTGDLRILAKVVEVHGNRQLAETITLRSNNQNPIKPRDLRSNNPLQARLKEEFNLIGFEDYQYEVKRGEQLGGNVITNEEAGRLLLAFDLQEPWSCHQIYKVFDEMYADIFGRPVVNAWRIIILSKIMERVQGALGDLDNEAFARYSLTRFFMLYCLSRIMNSDDGVRQNLSDARALLNDKERCEAFLTGVESIVAGIVLDLKHEAEEDETFDYKSVLKSPQRVTKLGGDLFRSYEKDVRRGREKRLAEYV